MPLLNSFKSKIFQINNQNFEEHALELFQFQYEPCGINQSYVNHLDLRPKDVLSLTDIPFMPIQFFKKHKVVSGNFVPKQVFESSGTTGNTSKHYIEDPDFYTEICTWIFEQFYSKIKGSVVVGLLPSYLERSNSSLVFMVDQFIKKSNNDLSGFYLDDYTALIKTLRTASESSIPVYLFGVTFALLELARSNNIDVENVTVLETGGMKGRRKELVRHELHNLLRKGFGVPEIHSEYGMTELLSQAYSDGGGNFRTPPWMKVIARDPEDPLTDQLMGKTGGLNIIDLVNLYSCSFIATQDLGKINADGSFEILGRFDNSDIRGCNLMLL